MRQKSIEIDRRSIDCGSNYVKEIRRLVNLVSDAGGSPLCGLKTGTAVPNEEGDSKVGVQIVSIGSESWGV